VRSPQGHRHRVGAAAPAALPRFGQDLFGSRNELALRASPVRLENILLPTIVGTAHSADGVALTAAVTSLTALAGVLIQPLARRLDGGPRDHAAGMLGLTVLAAGMALAALTAETGENWLLFPCAIVLGSAYGLCLVAGLLEVQRLAPERALASLTATYYAFTYLGFAAPYLLTVAANATSYAVLLVIASGLAVLTAVVIGAAPRDETPLYLPGSRRTRRSQGVQQVRDRLDHGVRT
jgi:hypothetical protein